MTEVRELLDAAADGVEVTEVPVAAVLAAGRRRVRRQRWAGAGAVVAVAAATLAVVPLGPDGGGLATAFRPGGEARCGDVRVDRAALPGRRVDPALGEFPTERAADLLDLHGWPRAVPYDAAGWSVVVRGDTGVLVARLSDGSPKYLPITRDAGGEWVVGPPCTLR